MSASQPFTVGLIQEAVSPDVATNVNDAITKIRQAHAQGAQIICLQELFNCQYFCKAQKGERFELAEPIPGPTVTAMEAIAKELGRAHCSDLRATGGRCVPQLGRRHRCRWQPAWCVSQDAHSGRSVVQREVLLHAR